MLDGCNMGGHIMAGFRLPLEECELESGHVGYSFQFIACHRLQVHNDDEVKALFKQVQGEVPGSPIFIMKVASQVSVQQLYSLIVKQRNSGSGDLLFKWLRMREIEQFPCHFIYASSVLCSGLQR